MKGKIVLITGANRGVGYFTASELALLGAEVVMVCRDPLRGSIARDAIAKVASGAPPALLLADLSSQASIRLLANEVRTKWNRIDVLLNNDRMNRSRKARRRCLRNKAGVRIPIRVRNSISMGISNTIPRASTNVLIISK